MQNNTSADPSLALVGTSIRFVVSALVSYTRAMCGECVQLDVANALAMLLSRRASSCEKYHIYALRGSLNFIKRSRRPSLCFDA